LTASTNELAAISSALGGLAGVGLSSQFTRHLGWGYLIGAVPFGEGAPVSSRSSRKAASPMLSPSSRRPPGSDRVT